MRPLVRQIQELMQQVEPNVQVVEVHSLGALLEDQIDGHAEHNHAPDLEDELRPN